MKSNFTLTKKTLPVLLDRIKRMSKKGNLSFTAVYPLVLRVPKERRFQRWHDGTKHDMTEKTIEIVLTGKDLTYHIWKDPFFTKHSIDRREPILTINNDVYRDFGICFHDGQKFHFTPNKITLVQSDTVWDKNDFHHVNHETIKLSTKKALSRQDEYCIDPELNPDGDFDIFSF